MAQSKSLREASHHLTLTSAKRVIHLFLSLYCCCSLTPKCDGIFLVPSLMGLQRLYRLRRLYRPSKYIFIFCLLLVEKIIKNTYFYVSWIFWTSWHKVMAKFKIGKLKVFKNNYLKFLVKRFVENGKDKLSKRILSWQTEFNRSLYSYLLVTSNIPRFSIKSQPVIMLRTVSFQRKRLNIFYGVKKQIYFSCITFFLTFSDKDMFFQEYIETELKPFFIIFEDFSKAKIKHSSSNF